MQGEYVWDLRGIGRIGRENWGYHVCASAAMCMRWAEAVQPIDFHPTAHIAVSGKCLSKGPPGSGNSRTAQQCTMRFASLQLAACNPRQPGSATRVRPVAQCQRPGHRHHQGVVQIHPHSSRYSPCVVATSSPDSTTRCGHQTIRPNASPLQRGPTRHVHRCCKPALTTAIYCVDPRCSHIPQTPNWP